jgi:DNA-binding transcriptional ArsR family regulator
MESADRADALAVLADGLQGFGHPTRIRALVLLEFEASPSELAQVIKAPLGVVSYHVRMLRAYGLVAETRTEPRRGALAHFYKRTELADELLAKLNGTLDIPRRKPGRQGDERRNVLAEWVKQTAA